MALNEQLRVAVDEETKLALLQAVQLTGRDNSELIRACIVLALPTLVSTPGLIPLCQPGVLRTSPVRG